MTNEVNEIVNDALFRWANVTGATRSRRSGTISLSGGWDDLTLNESIEELNASREMDDTGLTTFMMLRGLTEEYLRAEKFTAFDLILEPGKIEERLAQMRALRDTLEHPLVLERIADFEAAIRKAADAVDFTAREKLDELLTDRYQLAYVRRDALLSMTRLDAHQFTYGDPDPRPLLMNPHVWEFWNVNSYVRALRGQRVPGVSMTLIRDPEVMHSFFVIGVKNGDAITVLTDREEGAHPAANRMSRRPDRQLQNRAEKHWFPYHLLDLKVSGDQKRLYAKDRTSLVPTNVVGVKLADVKALGPEQFVWWVLLSDRIREKFHAQHAQLPELSYTGEMVVTPHVLVGSDGALVASGQYRPLEMPALSNADLGTASADPQWEQKPLAFHQWMVDRYAEKVPEIVLNVTGDQQRKLIETATGLTSKDSWGKRHDLLEALSPENFGTKAKLETDRIWAARHNQMIAINGLARAEYEEIKGDVLAWFNARVLANAPALLDAAARGELVMPAFRQGDSGAKEYVPFVRRWYLAKQNAVTQYSGKRFKYPYPRHSILGKWIERGGRWYCAERRDTRASIFTIIKVSSPEAIAIVAGVDVKELPWPLQHWHRYHDTPYTGNHILDRLDPIDWVLRNPWSEKSFDVGIAQSKRAFAARRKALGLDPAVYPPELTD